MIERCNGCGKVYRVTLLKGWVLFNPDHRTANIYQKETEALEDIAYREEYAGIA